MKPFNVSYKIVKCVNPLSCTECNLKFQMKPFEISCEVIQNRNQFFLQCTYMASRLVHTGAFHASYMVIFYQIRVHLTELSATYMNQFVCWEASTMTSNLLYY